MITVENVSRRYGDFIAVDNVSFSISAGEIVGLLGHNGAGKTTIMKMLTGFLEPTEGSITIDGKDIFNNRQEVQKEIGYLPENCPVYPEMTVVNYLDYAASLQCISGDERSDKVVEVISQTALKGKAHQTIATLSRGYRQRVGVAQAILHKPKILILDEPTNGLDPTQILQMRELIKNLANHSTIIVSTHILQEVQAVCDRVLIVRNGELALDTRLDSLESENKLVVTVAHEPGASPEPLGMLEGVENIQMLNNADQKINGISYLLSLKKNQERDEIAAAAAKCVHDIGWDLYSLGYESRDLEKVFAQISTQ